MGVFKKLEEATICENKPLVVCGKGHGRGGARSLLDSTGRDKYLVAAINQAVLFFEDVDFMFCVDVGVLIDLRDRGYDFSRVKNFVCPLHLAECERFDIKNKKIIWIDDHAHLQSAKSQSECLRIAADFFPESTNIYTYQDKMRLSSFELDDSPCDLFQIGRGGSTLHAALQWLNLTGLADSPPAGMGSFYVFGVTPYSSIAKGLESTSTIKPDFWYEMNFNHTLFLLQSFATDWVVYSERFMYKSMLDERGYPMIGVENMFTNERRAYPFSKLPFAEMEKKAIREKADKQTASSASTEKADKQTASSASPSQDSRASGRWGSWAKSQQTTKE